MLREWLDNFFKEEEKVTEVRSDKGLIFSPREKKYQVLLSREYLKYKRKLGLAP